MHVLALVFFSGSYFRNEFRNFTDVPAHPGGSWFDEASPPDGERSDSPWGIWALSSRICFLRKCLHVGWQRAADDLFLQPFPEDTVSGMWCSLSGPPRCCSAGGGELPVGDFHSLCPPKKSFPSPKPSWPGVWCWKQRKFEGMLWCQHSAGELLMCSRGRRWCQLAYWSDFALEDVSFSGTFLHRTVGMSPLQGVHWKIKYFL